MSTRRHPNLFEVIYSIFICTRIVHHLGILFDLHNVMQFISIHIPTVLFYFILFYKRGEGGFIGSWWGNWRERVHWGDLGVDGWIILRWISRRWDVGMWTG